MRIKINANATPTKVARDKRSKQRKINTDPLHQERRRERYLSHFWFYSKTRFEENRSEFGTRAKKPRRGFFRRRGLGQLKSD